jgi:outer membrane putative beta-barrel porin/alpha-amylase
MSKTRSSLVIWTTLIALVVPALAHAADEQWQIGSTPSFSSGSYGSDTRTEVLQTPITARRLFSRGDVTVVLPFLCVWGTGNVTVVNGIPVRQQRLAFASASVRASATAAPVSTRTCGLGDVVVRGRYYVIDEHGWLPTVAIRGHVKTPTADPEQGLGTGQPDEGAGLEVSRSFRSGTTTMVDGGYTAIGKPDGVIYNNNWWYDIGLAQDVGPRAKSMVNVSIFYEEYRAIVPGLENARDVLATLSLKGAKGWRLQLAGEVGLSSSAPDHAFTLGAGRRF